MRKTGGFENIQGVLMALCMVITAAFAAHAASYALSVKANQRTQAWNRYYEKSISTDHMYTVLHSFWNRGCANALKVSNAN